MPILAALKPLYPANWFEISNHVRFVRAGGCCEACGRRHGAFIYQLLDGRWRVLGGPDVWRDDEGREAAPAVLLMGGHPRVVRVVLTTAHRNHDPSDNREANLAAWCGRCHLAHDARHHWLAWRARMAIGDLFDGLYVPPGDRSAKQCLQT